MASPSAGTPSLYTDPGSEPEHEESQSLVQLLNQKLLVPEYFSFTSALEGSLRKLIVKSHYGPYNSVHVLFLAWKTPDTSKIKELAQLEKLFKNNLESTIERYEIHGEGVQDSLNSKLDEVVRSHAGVDELLIIHYAGHGRSNTHEKITTWQPHRRSPTPEDYILRPLNWSDIKFRLKHSVTEDSNILYILNSSSTPSMHQSTSRGSKELLANGQAGGDYSFTTDLSDELQAQFPATDPITVGGIHILV